MFMPCPLLTESAPVYGIVIPILLIWYGIVTCSIVHNFKLLTFNHTHPNLCQAIYKLTGIC
jgi:hypothetical protein